MDQVVLFLVLLPQYIVLDVSRASLREVAPKALFLWELCIKVVL